MEYELFLLCIPGSHHQESKTEKWDETYFHILTQESHNLGIYKALRILPWYKLCKEHIFILDLIMIIKLILDLISSKKTIFYLQFSLPFTL